MTDHELAEHLAAIRRHVPELADWYLDTARVQLHIAGHPQQDGWHTFDRDVVEGWAAEAAGPVQLRLRVV